PTAGEARVKVAWPLTSATGACAVPSMVKVTVPPGVPAPGATALTVAVKVTAWPKTDGLVEEVRAVVVLALFTTWVRAPDVLGLKLPSLLYAGGTVCLPRAGEGVLLLAPPPARAPGPPKLAPSIWNCTVPVGVPAPGATAATVAVNVTACPNTDGLADELTAVAVSALL